MVFRYASGTLALLFGLLLSFVIIGQGMHYGFKFDWRTVLAVVAIAGAATAFSRLSIWFVIVAMVLQIATYYDATIGTIGAILEGFWSYSWPDIWSLPLAILPVLSLLFAVMADGRIQSAYHLVRRGPFQENA